MNKKRILIMICALIVHTAAFAIEVRVYPKDHVYAYELDPGHNLTTVMVHNIAVVNNTAASFSLESVEIKAMQGGDAVHTMMSGVTELNQAAKKAHGMAAQGLFKIYDFHFQTSRYLPENLAFAESVAMNPNSVILLTSRALMLQSPAEELVITVRGNSDGKPAEASAKLKVQTPARRDYVFPLTGVWYVGAAPSLHSHHRWVANQEFALDLVQIGANGKTHDGNGSKLSEYFAYGKDVVAIGDGEVVEARSDATESDSNLRQPDESTEAYEQRVMMLQMEMIKKGYKEPVGNFVIIKHANGEFSHYAHLNNGSVKVKAGDLVKKGQTIGRLGHSGNSTEPHLHFQVTDGADPMYSRGIPVYFNNVSVEGLGNEDRLLQTGWIVTAK